MFDANRSRFIIPLEVDFDYLLEWLGPVKTTLFFRKGKKSSTLPGEGFLEWTQRDFQGLNMYPVSQGNDHFKNWITLATKIMVFSAKTIHLMDFGPPTLSTVPQN